MKTSAESTTNDIEHQLELRRSSLRNAIRQQLHQSDDPKIMAFANHMSEVDDWVEADLLNDTDIAQCNLELAELREVEAALQRIKSGSYGVCIDCGESISSGRMSANLVAQRCLDCQENFERTHTVVAGT